MPTRQQTLEISQFVTEKTSLADVPKIVAFVNSKSGGQIGALLMEILQHNLRPARVRGDEIVGEVCDLSKNDEPSATIERLARKTSLVARCGGTVGHWQRFGEISRLGRKTNGRV